MKYTTCLSLPTEVCPLVIGAVSPSFDMPAGHGYASSAPDIPGSLKGIPFIRRGEDWITIVLLLVFAVLAWLKVYYRREAWLHMSAFLESRFVRQLLQEENPYSNRASLALTLVFLLVFSLFIYDAWSVYGIPVPGEKGFYLFLKLLAMLGAFLAVKVCVVRFCGLLFRAEREMSEYAFYFILSGQILGLMLLPVVISEVYVLALPGLIFIKSGLVLAALTFLFRVGRKLYMGILSTTFSPVYIILYLCALEIFPLAILYKLLLKPHG